MSNNFIEIKISVRDENQKLQSKHAIYEDNLRVNRDDPTLKDLVEQAIADFKGSSLDPDFDVVVNIKYTW